MTTYPRPLTPRCDCCAAPLSVHDGETFCPDCTRYAIALSLEAARQTLARLHDPEAERTIEEAFWRTLEEEAAEGE